MIARKHQTCTRAKRLNGKFAPGHSGNPGGRPKGSKNKFTELKNVFIEALEEVGGKEFVIDHARKDPKASLSLIAKMLPRYSEIKTEKTEKAAPIVIVNASADECNEN